MPGRYLKSELWRVYRTILDSLNFYTYSKDDSKIQYAVVVSGNLISNGNT